ncbi:hypothetical protein D3C80_2182410 [compost metagenome]
MAPRKRAARAAPKGSMVFTNTTDPGLTWRNRLKNNATCEPAYASRVSQRLSKRL